MSNTKSVNVIMPIFNRAKFLSQAFQSLNDQAYTDFELIIVDDGSKDDTDEVLALLIEEVQFKVSVVKQQNGGPACARNKGLEFADAEFIAFFDSDDSWDKNHLAEAIAILKNNDDIDWVYFGARHIDMTNNNTVVLDSNFHINNNKQPLFKCIEETRLNVNILHNQNAVRVQLETGLDCAFQNSVIRRHIFDSYKIPDHRIGEDRLFVLKVLKSGYKLAFVDEVTATYNIHESNICDANQGSQDFDKRFDVLENLINSYIDTPNHAPLDKREMSTLKKRIANEYFWLLGYSLQIANKYYRKGLVSMLKGIAYDPCNVRFYKTFIVAFFKAILRL